MPKTIRVLTPEEIPAPKNNGHKKGESARALLQKEYDTLIADLNAGDYASVELEANENKVNVRNCIKGAAKRRKLGVEFRRTRDNSLTFRLVPLGEQQADEAEA